MEQRFETSPRAELKLNGRRATRSEVSNDWGLQLRWVIYRDGKQIGTASARLETSFEHSDKTPGEYQIVLEMWKYVDYKKDAKGEFTNSKFVEISNKVSFKI